MRRPCGGLLLKNGYVQAGLETWHFCSQIVTINIGRFQKWFEYLENPISMWYHTPEPKHQNVCT